LIAPDQIRQKILAALPGAEITVRDLTGTADHYEVVVVSGAFAGRSLIERHRMVYAPLQDVLGGALHALSLKTLAPGE
jgi:stress-induced morphogen